MIRKNFCFRTPASSSVRRKQGVIASYVYTFAQVLVNFLYIPLLLSVIGRDEYGLYQTVGPIMSYVVSINSVLSAGVGRYYSMYKAAGNERMMENTLAIAKRLYWGLSVLAVLVVGAIIPVFRSTYAGSFTATQVDECCAMLCVLAVNTVVTFNNAINIAAINANERFVFLKTSQLITLIAQPILILLLGKLMPNALVITIVVLAMNILCATLQRIYARGYLHVSYRFHGWDMRLVRGLLGFSVSIVMVTVADQIFWSSGKLVVAYYFGSALVAVYAVGAQVYSAYMQAGLAVSGVFFQRVSELYHREHDASALSALFTKVGRVTFLICSVILGGYIVLGRDFVTLWAGDLYGDAYWIALIVMLPLTVDLCQNLGLTILQVEDKYYFRGVVYLALSAINLVISLYTAPRFGIVSVALSSGVCMFIGNVLIMNWYYAARVGLDIAGYWKGLAGLGIPFIFATMISGIVYSAISMEHGGILTFLAGGAIYLAFFMLIVGRFGLNDYERSQIRNILAKFHK